VNGFRFFGIAERETADERRGRALAASAGSPPAELPAAGSVRCAIYTRKSIERGLEQEFNSLDLQREACEAFITSQKHAGWVALRVPSTTAAIRAATWTAPRSPSHGRHRSRKVDEVVTYKVDRMSRSLGDFAKMMEVFERKKVSFVSVTQHFYTATSLGRLILHILLSFAQFERETIIERVRDKMSAARRKGKWIGGNPVLATTSRRKGEGSL